MTAESLMYELAIRHQVKIIAKLVQWTFSAEEVGIGSLVGSVCGVPDGY